MLVTSKIDVRDVTKVYPGGVRAVHELTLSVQDREIVALLGPSGCGKSTVLRLISGFEQPDSGTIVIDDRKVAGDGAWIPPERRGIGMVFQDYPLFPHKTVLQNVAFGLHKMTKATATERARETLDQVNLGSCADRYPHQLSGGQQQRVALAQALAPKPTLLLLDEPFSNLDASLRQELRVEVRRILRDAGTSTIIVTHDQKEAFTMADRIAVMNQGEIEQVGTPANIYGSPKTEFVARFVGHSAILPGVVRNGSGEVLTDLGVVPCAAGLVTSGDNVTISLRPDSLQVDPDGPLKGLVVSAIHEGHVVELSVQMPCGAATITLKTFVPPEMGIREGDSLRFAIAPEKVSVIA